MKAMIFAAGEGRRMRPLTLTTPKPLLQVQGAALIEHHLRHLSCAGFTEVVINVAYLGEQILEYLGDGANYGLNIQYSVEAEPLETGGGIRKALPLLGDGPFVLISADIWCDFPLAELRRVKVAAAGAHLILVPNPAHKTQGDFELNQQGQVTAYGAGLTYSGISVIHPQMIAAYPNARDFFPMVEALKWAMTRGHLSAQVYSGVWVDVGTPERLAELNTTA